MLPAATRNYVSSILTSDFKTAEKRKEKGKRVPEINDEFWR